MKIETKGETVFVSCSDITGCISDVTLCRECPLFLYDEMSLNDLIKAVKAVTLRDIRDGYYASEGYTYEGVQQKGGDA